MQNIHCLPALAVLIFFLFGQTLSAQNEFITTWKTDNPGTSANDEITIPGTGNYQIAYQEVGNPTNMSFILQAG